MLFLSLMRREAARLVLSELARAVAVDPVLIRRASRPQHLRNGFAALLDVSSQVVVRPRLASALFYATREGTRAELRYGFAELRRAAALDSDTQRRLLLVAAPSAAAGLALAVRARRDTGQVAPLASTEPPVATAVGT
jgi:hypothetical protein